MAIKASNKITIVEHKKIKEIKEWYLATSKDTGVTRETEGWTEAIQTMTTDKKYLWNYEETIYSIGPSSDVTDPVIVGVYGETGAGGASLQIKYISSETMPVITNNNVSAWSDAIPSPVDGEKIYMTQKLSTDLNWSTPIQISASDGKDGSANIEINNDGYWVINGEVTEVKAEGSDGRAPTIEIIDGYWFIDGENSDVKAEGEVGKDGSDIEFVYYRSKTSVTLSAPSYTNGVLTSGWTESPQGITNEYKYEYVSIRTKPSGGEWNAFSTPVIWSKWGEKGQDGDGVEYKYYLSNSSVAPTYSSSDSKWTDDPTGVSINNQYEYVIQIKTINGVSTPAEKASLWAKYGEDGRGITIINNYYATTKTTDTPTANDWQLNKPKNDLSPEYKYLWNYEEIQYTTGNPTTTDPSIIGAYGDSGTDAVDFQIYSVDGFEFSQSLTTIELRTVAFSSGQDVSEYATYQWKYWKQIPGAEGTYENISGATSSNLIVDKASEYALSSLKCEMTYNNITYEDYVTLTMQSSIYTSAIKFFDGSNIFNSNSTYIVAYVELYKNNVVEETVSTKQYYTGISSITSTGTIETSVEGEFNNGDLMYFICKNNDGEYIAILGEYSSGRWYESNNTNKYLYINDLHKNVTSNVIVISKEDVPRTKEIVIQVYQIQYDENNNAVYNDDTLVSRTSAIVSDLNDPIISDIAPANAKPGQLWLNTSVNPYELMICTPGTKYEVALGRLVESVNIFSMVGSATNTRTFYYSDTVDVLDDKSVVMPSSASSKSISYNTFGNLYSLTKNKYLYDGTTVYYVSESSTFTKSSRNITNGSFSFTVYEGNAHNVYLVDVQTVPSDECSWVYFSQQSGGAIYTSKPSKYSAGDLWILADNETCGNFGPGTLLKATVSSDMFNESHWTDTMEDITTTITNIKESFAWDDDGIKVMRRITDSNGNVTNPFYVHIDSTRMGFHSVEYDNNNVVKKDVEVVHIGNNSATIQNATFDGDNGTTFNNDATFNKQININGTNSSGVSVGFIWNIESNGSLSLAIET